MSKYKMILLAGFIVLAFGVGTISTAVAGEKINLKKVWHTTKYEEIQIGDVEGHVVAIYEGKAISINTGGKSFGDGWTMYQAGTSDINTKTGIGSVQGYEVLTDKDGDKIFWIFEGKGVKPGFYEGSSRFIKGTGKFEGIQGKGTWSYVEPVPGQGNEDWDGEVDLPSR